MSLFIHSRNSVKSVVWILLFITAFVSAKTPEECDELIRKGVVAMYERDHERSLALLVEARRVSEENHWHKQLFLSINNIGANYFSMLDYGEALEHYLEAYTIAIKNLDEDYEMIVLNNIAILFSKEKQYDKAEEYFNKAYRIAKQKKEDRKIGMYAVNLGIVHSKKGQFNEAKNYLDEAVELLKESPDILRQAHMALANNHLQSGESQKAKAIVQLLLNSMASTDTYESDILLTMSKVHQAETNFAEAEIWAQKALGKASDIDARISVFEHLSDVYQQSNQLHAALQMKDSLFSAQDSLNQMKNGRLFEANRVKFEIRNYQKQLSDNQQKLAAERSFFYTLISIAVLVIALITWALRNSYIKNKQRKIIHKRSEEIMELELEKEKSDKLLLENRLKKKETLALLEQEKLKNEIESKNRKLTVKALHLSSNNQFIETIMQSLSGMTEASRNVDIKNLEKQLKLHLKSGSEWDEFFTHFEEVNQGFISSLREKHPDLTSNDIRFLSYVFMNLTTKEIASLFNITPEACRKRKERISKKMNLIDNTDLYSYLSAI